MKTNAIPVLSIAMSTMALTLTTGCSSPAPAITPAASTGSVQAPAEVNRKLVVIDTSGSAEATDLFAIAQNKTADLVKGMTVGSTVAIRALNSDVTALCNDVLFTLPPQKNQALLNRARQSNEAAVAIKVPKLIACSKKYSTATELFGGLSEAFRTYADATEARIYSDLCENATIGNICDPKRLADPKKIAKAVPGSITPKLPSSFHAIYVGAGRGSKLDAESVENLRKAVGLWTERTGATFEFANG